MQKNLDLRNLFQILKKRIWLIVLLTFISTSISGLISFFYLIPIYQSSTQILVNQEKSEQQFISSGEIQTNLQLISTYSGIIKSPAILELVKEQLKLDNRSVGQLDAQIQVTNRANSQILYITVQDSDPTMAAKIANTTAEVFKREIVEIMSVNNVSILAKADVATSPIKPDSVRNMTIGLFVGAAIGIFLVLLLDYLDNTVKNEQDVEQLLKSPVIGVVMTIDSTASPISQASNKGVNLAKGESANV